MGRAAKGGDWVVPLKPPSAGSNDGKGDDSQRLHDFLNSIPVAGPRNRNVAGCEDCGESLYTDIRNGEEEGRDDILLQNEEVLRDRSQEMEAQERFLLGDAEERSRVALSESDECKKCLDIMRKAKQQRQIEAARARSAVKALVRIRNEQKKMDIPGGVQFAPAVATDLLYWIGTIPGPDDGPYADGIFRFEVRIPPAYPKEAPRFKFITPIKHPQFPDQKLQPLKGWAGGAKSRFFDVVKEAVALLEEPQYSSSWSSLSVMTPAEIAAFKKEARQLTEKYAIV